MNRFILSIFILFMYVQMGQAQTASSSESDSVQAASKEHNNNAVYLSVGGTAVAIYSLNYERRIGKQFWARAGFSYAPLLDVSRGASVPLGINKLLGKESKFFEIGLGTTLYFSDIDTSFNLFGDDDDDNNNITPDFNILLTGTFGYRYQPVGEHFIFKIGLSPIFVLSTGDFFLYSG